MIVLMKITTFILIIIHRGLREGLEDDDLVEAVEELGPEEVLELLVFMIMFMCIITIIINRCVYTYIYIYIHVLIYIYIHTHREREIPI